MLRPPYFKDPHGFCYCASPRLMGSALAPWFGQVDAAGFAVPGTEPELEWAGQTVVCLASGPSLIAEDVAATQHMTTVVTNDTYRMAPHAAALYAADLNWWERNHQLVPATMACWTGSVPAAREYGARLLQPDYGVSGAAAIMLAARLGAARVILLGHDCSVVHGSHWHGDHEGLHNPRAAEIPMWHKQYRHAAELLRGQVRVVNCSRDTELECFECASLTQAISDTQRNST